MPTTIIISHDGYRIDGGSLVPGAFLLDTWISEANPAANFSADTKTRWGLSAGLRSRGLLVVSLPALLSGVTVVSARWHFRNGTPDFPQNWLGPGNTTFERGSVAGVTAAATWLTKDGVTAWQAAGGGSDFTSTNAITSTASFNAHVITLLGFGPQVQDAINGATGQYIARARMEIESGSPASRGVNSVEFSPSQYRPELEIVYTTTSEPGDFEITAPGDGATDQLVSDLVISWSPSSDATAYEILLDTADPPEDSLVSGLSGSATSYTVPTTLDPETEYFIQVIATNAAGDNETSVFSFTTAAAPVQHDAAFPVDFSGCKLTPTPLMWSDAGDPVNEYEIHFGTANPPPLYTTVVGGGGEYSLSLPTEYGGGTYYIRIDAIGNGGETEGNVTQFTTMSAPAISTDPSVADEATDVAIDVGTLTADQQSGCNPNEARLYLGITNRLSEANYNQSVTGEGLVPTTIEFTIADLIPGTTYFWRVDLVNEAGTTEGPTWSFTTAGSLPEACATNQSPAQNAGNVALDATLTWDEVDGATGYDVWFAKFPAALALVSEDQEELEYDPGGMDAESGYRWRIDPRNASGILTGCSVLQFTTEGAPPVRPFGQYRPSARLNRDRGSFRG